MGKKNHKRKAQNDGRRDDSLLPRSSNKKIKNNPQDDRHHPQSPAETADTNAWSKSKKKRMRKIMARQQRENSGNGSRSNEDDSHGGVVGTDTTAIQQASIAKPIKSSSMQDAFRARLAGSRFRILNEELYTTTSQESFERFKTNPELFSEYHEGFRSQVASWPLNPVTAIVRSLKKAYSGTKKPGGVICADFGCGDAQLAKDLLAIPDTPFTVHSFDLVAKNELITACDMANVPLKSKTVDVCVFCLALMGTNLADFIREAHRVLKDHGRVMIAEVRSRFEYGEAKKPQRNGNNSNDERRSSQGTLKEFIVVLDKLGFHCAKVDRSNTMFLLLELKKNDKKPDRKLSFSAKPCIYKKR